MIDSSCRQETLAKLFTGLMAVGCTSSDPCPVAVAAGEGGTESALAAAGRSGAAAGGGPARIEPCPVDPESLTVPTSIAFRYLWDKPTSCRFDLLFLDGSVASWPEIMWSDGWVTVLIDCVEVPRRTTRPASAAGAGGAAGVAGMSSGGAAGDVAAAGTSGRSSGEAAGFAGGLDDNVPFFNWRTDVGSDPRALEILGPYCDQIKDGVERVDLWVHYAPEP